jgi:hypothetical protein
MEYVEPVYGEYGDAECRCNVNGSELGSDGGELGDVE